MQRVAQIEQRVRSGQAAKKFLARHSDAAHFTQLVNVVRGRLMQQAVTILQTMFVEQPLEFPNARFILARVGGCGQKLEPDRIETEAPQPEHPLQRHGKIAAAFGIFRGKAAAEKDGHDANNRKRRTPNVQR